MFQYQDIIHLKKGLQSSTETYLLAALFIAVAEYSPASQCPTARYMSTDVSEKNSSPASLDSKSISYK